MIPERITQASLITLVTLLGAACSSPAMPSDATTSDTSDVSVPVDVGDSSLDAPIDAPRDAVPDVASDTASDAPSDASVDAGTSAVRVVGNRLERNGASFEPHGFNMIGVLTPDACTGAPGSGIAARASFGMPELIAARDSYHANIVRLQISQRGLDPTDSIHDAAYVRRVQQGVSLARSLGFTVIISMQDQSISCGMAHALPTAATVRAWTATAPLFRDDPAVLFELFNEPDNAPTTAGWQQWRAGGTTPIDLGEPSIGHQALVDLIRSLGAHNVLIADGANKAGRLEGIPLLTDSLSPPQIAYGLHPYYFHTSSTATLAADATNWDGRFGYLTAMVPVLATEWNASASCFTGQAARIPDFFAYLTAHHIGLFGHAFDVPNTMIISLATWMPTMFTGCVAGSDAGTMVQTYFATLSP